MSSTPAGHAEGSHRFPGSGARFTGEIEVRKINVA
jgi:hypothetical protein